MKARSMTLLNITDKLKDVDVEALYLTCHSFFLGVAAASDPFLDVARPRQAIGQAERREASPRESVGGGRASSRNPIP
eukprot:1195160-Prorocentrum_minimum.AAC.4